MAAYLALARLAFRQQFSYRLATLAGLLTNAFFGALRAYVLIALFAAQGGGPAAGYSIEAAVTYTGITQALIAFVALWGWWDLIRSIRTGQVAADLARPVDFLGYWCAQDVGRGLAQLLLRGVPMLILYGLVYPVRWPPTLTHWLALAVALMLALLICFTWRFLLSLSAFWTQDATGLMRAGSFLAIFLSGFAMPTALLPDWLRALTLATPFPAIINTPVEVFLGLRSGQDLWLALLTQALWLGGLVVAARLVLAAGVKKLVIQGG